MRKFVYRRILLLWSILFHVVLCAGQSTGRVAPYTLDDRDRMIRLEEQIQSLRNEMNARFEGQQKETQSIRNEMQSIRNEMQSIRNEMQSIRNEMMTKFETLYWGFGILISVMLFLLGYIIWDRKSAMEPLRERTYSISEKYNNLVQVLREYAAKQPELSEILKTHGIL